MPNADILEFLFATVATIVATVTGLIGAFATFRLQNIRAHIKNYGDKSILAKTEFWNYQ
jgi:hypothetical protein